MFYKVKIKKLPQAKTGMQVQGALFNDFAGMASSNRNTTSEESKLIESKYIKAVPVDKANVEAEGGETVYGDINGDGIPEHKIIKGPRHTHGGVPLNLPEDTFIFSDTPGMRIKDPEVLKSFGFTAKSGGYTPAAIAKRYDVDKYRKILEDSNSDAIEKRTAELMIKKYIVKLGCLALEQESMKGFPQGIPVAAKPCMQARGLTEEDILPDEKLSGLNDQLKKQKEQQEQQANSAQTLGSENQEAQAMSMNQGQPVAQAQPTEQPMSQEGMMKFGGMRRLRRANEGMQQPSEEEMMMMMQQQQQQQQQPQQGGGDQMQQIMQQVGQALQQGAKPEEVAAQLIQSQIPPELVAQIFVQLGMPQDQVQQLIASIMQQMQGAQEEMMRWGGQRRLRRAQQGMAQPSEEEMMMMQQQAQGAPQQEGGQEQMQQIMQQVGEALKQGAKPEEVIAQLLQGQIPPEAIMQIFVQLGMPEEQVGGLIQSVMSQLQGGQQQMMAQQGQQPMSNRQMKEGGDPCPDGEYWDPIYGCIKISEKNTKEYSPEQINDYFKSYEKTSNPFRSIEENINPDYWNQPKNKFIRKLLDDNNVPYIETSPKEYIIPKDELTPEQDNTLFQINKHYTEKKLEILRKMGVPPSDWMDYIQNMDFDGDNPKFPSNMENEKFKELYQEMDNEYEDNIKDCPCRKKKLVNNKVKEVCIPCDQAEEGGYVNMNTSNPLTRFFYGGDPKLMNIFMGDQQQGGQMQQPMSEEEAMMMQQQQMQQAPMAAYGAQMGGYDMPFYDMPEAKQGAVIDNYSNRRYSRSNSLPKAGPGIIIDATTMDDAALRRAIYDAQQKDPTAVITVNRKGKDGKVTSEILDTKNSGWKLPTGDDIKASDLNGFDGSTANGRLAAAQYMLIKQNLENPTVRAQIIKNAKEALENPDAWTGKGGTRNNNNKWSIQFPGAPPSDQEIIDAALAHQKRNLMFESKGIDPQLFNDNGDALSSASHVVSKEYINPLTQKPYTLAEATNARKKLISQGFTNTNITAQKLGVDLSSNRKDRILQQSTMHAYGKAYKDFTDGKFKADADAQYAMNNFLGNVNMATAGANDEKSMARLYGPMGARISPLDGIVGNTDAGHRFITASNNYAFSPVDCQCTDPDNTATYSKFKDKDGKCTCTPPEEVKKCPCGEEMLEPVNGVCPPCDKEITIKKPAPPAEFWLQDTIKTAAAAADLAGVKNYGPMAQRFDMQDPRPNFVDPTRELARQREDASMITAGLEGFAGGQDLSVRSTGIQSQLAKSAADTLSAYDNKNVGIGDAFEIKGTDIMNQERTANSNAGALLYRENTIGNQQYDNSKRALTGNLVNQYTNAITNKWKTDATNQMYPQFAVSSGVGGRMFYKEGKDHQIDTSNDTAAWEEAYDWCLARKDKDPSSCATRRMASKNKSQDQQGPNSYPGANNSYPGVAGVDAGSGVKYGGPIFKDGGYIDIASWLPYLK